MSWIAKEVPAGKFYRVTGPDGEIVDIITFEERVAKKLAAALTILDVMQDAVNPVDTVDPPPVAAVAVPK